jgi:hypothetical protein
LLPGRDVETVEREIVLLDADMRVLEAPSASKRPFRGSSPSIATVAKARARAASAVSSLAPASAPSSPATIAFSASCCVSNSEVRLPTSLGASASLSIVWSR